MKGFDAVRQLNKELDGARAARANSKFVPELWQGLRNPGDRVQVRFLEQGEDVHVAWMHEYKVGKWFKYAKCLDENNDGSPCPGCEKDFRRTVKGVINVIWRDRPQLKKDSDGRAIKSNSGQFEIVGNKDEVVVWMQGIESFTELANKDTTYKGLSTRDFTITKKVKGYSIDPVTNENGDVVAVPMTADDNKLASEKYNLEDHYMKVYSPEELDALLQGGAPPAQEAERMQEVRSSGSPWNQGEGRANRGEARANRFLDGN